MPTRTRRSPTVTRTDFDALKAEVRRLSEILEAHIAIIRRNRHDHEVSFQRIAQLQADLDALKAAMPESPAKSKGRRT